MIRRILCALAGAALGATAAALLWWPLLALFALAFDVPRAAGTVKDTLVIAAMPLLGAANGAITGAVRGRLGGGAAVEMLGSPFAWMTTAGEGFLGGVVMLLSLVPGACVGGLAGLWVADTPADSKLWPAEAAVGAVVGVTLSLLALNLFVQWPTLTGKPEGPKPPAPPAEAAK